MNQIDYLTAPLRPWLDDPSVEEICIQGRPDVCWIWRHGQFTSYPVNLSNDDLMDIAILAGSRARQDVGPARPLLAADLPGGLRLQVVLPPCVEAGTVSLTIRKAAAFSPTLESLADGGLFSQATGMRATADDEDLRTLYRAGDWLEFLRAATRAKKTTVICGVTASGKTTLAKAIIEAIPLDERLITIEDTPEWTNLPHPNRVALYYSKGGQNTAQVGASELVEAALRMRIGRLLVQEIRDGHAALAFLSALASGHPGGITTIHAAHAEAAFDRMRIELRKTPGGAAQHDADVRDMLRSSIDVVVHCARDGQKFRITEVWYAGAPR